MSTLAQKAREGRIIALKSLQERNMKRDSKSVIFFRSSRHAVTPAANTQGYEKDIRVAA